MVEAQDANELEDGAERDVTPPWESDQREVLRATFDQDAEAYDRMMSGEARFRVVLTMEG